MEIPREVILVTDLWSANHRRSKQINGVSFLAAILAAPKPLKNDKRPGRHETNFNPPPQPDHAHEVLMPLIRFVSILVVGMLVVHPLRAGEPEIGTQGRRPTRPVHTYSIVARDPKTGELGVAVQSHWFAIGPLVPWAEAGVGAVATQSFVDPSYGKVGLDLMRVGRSGPDALKGLLGADENRDVRQVAMIDSQGRVAAHTGSKCIPMAGHHVGKEYSVQANLMINDKVWPAMSRAFESAEGDLAERMLVALEAAQAAGGDIRGKQSAALVVVSGKPTAKPWEDRRFDIRVDDHSEPVAELRRLVKLQRAYNLMNEGDLAVERKDHEGALRAYAGAEALVPGNAEMIFWHAIALVNMKRVDESLPLFAKVFKMDPNWKTLTPRLVGAGLLPDDQAALKKILGNAASPVATEQ
jgi:uncharacterized Ntn-hydrolase superfamily protein